MLEVDVVEAAATVVLVAASCDGGDVGGVVAMAPGWAVTASSGAEHPLHRLVGAPHVVGGHDERHHAGDGDGDHRDAGGSRP